MEYLNEILETSNIEIKSGIINDSHMPKGEVKAVVIATGFRDDASGIRAPKFSVPSSSSGTAGSGQKPVTPAPSPAKNIDFPQLPKFKKY
jgi:cell division GTPase FtsZ